MPSYFLDPTSDIKAGWIEVPPGTAWSMLDDAVRQPTVPDLGDYMETSTDGGAAIIRAANSVIVPGSEEIVDVIGWVYATFPSTNHRFDFAIAVSPTQTPFANVVSDGWSSVQYGRGFQRLGSFVDLIAILYESAPEAGTTKIYAMYVELVTANPYAPDPQVGPGP